MAAFQYSQYRNPYVGSISDLMMRPADAQAAAAERIGQIQAQAAQQSGQAYAGAAQGVGNAIAGSIQQATDPRRKLEALQVGQAQQQVDDLKSLDRAFTQPGGRDAILGALPGHLRPTVAKQFQDVDKSAADLQEATLKAETATNAYVYNLADVAKAHNYDPAAMQLALSHAKDTFKNNPSLLQQVGQFESVLHANPSADTVRSIVDPIITAHDAQEKPVILPATPRGGAPASLVKPATGEVVKTGAPSPAQQPTPASIALDAAGGDPVEANKILHPTPQRNPPSIEEQLLEAVSKGDTATANRIKAVMHDTAMAHRDPAASALADELGGLRKDEAKARLDALQKKNQPLDVTPDVQTTGAGRKYLDLSSYSAEQRDKARDAATASGAVAIGKEQADSLQQIDNARMNQASILNQIRDLLPKDAAGRPQAAANVSLSKVFQTNDQVAAFGTWRTAAINSMRATAGSKGLRINRSEIEQAIENDIPKLTDTLGAAQQKVANVNTMLENAEKSILVRDRSVPDQAKPTTAAGFTIKVRP